MPVGDLKIIDESQRLSPAFSFFLMNIYCERLKNPLDKGDFKVGFSPITKARTPKKAMPKDEVEVLQGVADALNSLLAMPKDIYLNLDTCGEANAFYSPDSDEIIFCYELLDQFEREFIIRKLRENEWNISRTATVLGIERAHLHRKIKSLKITEAKEN